MSPFDITGYLRHLQIASVPQTADGLAELQAAQMMTVPFENIDPFLGKVPVLDLGAIADKTLKTGRGGYCFELNMLLEAALSALGFPVRRSLGRVRRVFERGNQRSHLVLLTEAEGRRFVADAGFGGPGPMRPLEIDTMKEQIASNGVYRLVDDPASEEKVVQRQEQDGWIDLYSFDEAYVHDMDIAAANYVCANWDQAPFRDHLMLAGFNNGQRIGVFDQAVTCVSASGERRREFRDFEDFSELVVGKLDITVQSRMLNQVWAKLSMARTQQSEAARR